MTILSPLLALLFVSGCHNKESSAPVMKTSSQGPAAVENSKLLANQLVKSFGTSGTFETDYEDASIFIQEFVPSERLAISPKEYLVKGYDLTFLAARKFHNKYRELTKTIIPYYLVFCRLFRNAKYTDNPKSRNQMVRDAVSVATLDIESPLPNFGNFKALDMFCPDKISCRDWALANILAVYIVVVNRLPFEKSRLYSREMAWLKIDLLNIGDAAVRCDQPQKILKYKQYFSEVFDHLRIILEPPTAGVLYDDHILNVLKRAYEIHSHLIQTLPC
jgi:hypothetical protein